MYLHQAVTHQQSGRDAGFNCFFMLPAGTKPIHDSIHVLDLGFIQFQLLGYVQRITVDNQLPAAFLPNVGQDKVQILAVLFEYRRSQLNLRAFR